MDCLNIAVIEDSSLWRVLIEHYLGKSKDFRIVLTCEIGDCFLEKFNRHKVDYILLDVHLPGESGIILSKRLQEICPHIPIVVFTSSNHPADISYFRSIGVKGYIHKSNIMHLASILKKITTTRKTCFNFGMLESHEMQLMNLVCQKLTNTQIAEAINKSEKTVEKNLKSLCQKLAIANSKIALFEFAVQHGYWNVHTPLHSHAKVAV
jgi:DNA-binding NarL/FixJ family response regulator